MSDPNIYPPTDPQIEELIRSLRNEIASLKSKLGKKDDEILTLTNMLKQIVEAHHAAVRAYADLENKLDDLIEMLRKRVPHGDILDFLKVRDSGEMRNYPI